MPIEEITAIDIFDEDDIELCGIDEDDEVTYDMLRMISTTYPTLKEKVQCAYYIYGITTGMITQDDVLFLISIGFNINKEFTLSQYNTTKYTSIILACEYRMLDIVSILISNNVDVQVTQSSIHDRDSCLNLSEITILGHSYGMKDYVDEWTPIVELLVSSGSQEPDFNKLDRY